MGSSRLHPVWRGVSVAIRGDITSVRLESNEAGLVGERDRLGAVAQIEPAQEVVHMGPDRGLRYREGLCDLRIRLAQGDEAEDLELTRRETSHGHGSLRSWRGKLAGHLVKETAGDLWRDEPLASRERPHRTNQLIGGAALEEKAPGAGSDGFEDVVVVCGGEDDDPGRLLEPRSGQQPDRPDALTARSGDVHDHDGGPNATGHHDRLAAGACLTHDLDTRLPLQNRPETGTDEGLLVTHENPDARR